MNLVLWHITKGRSLMKKEKQRSSYNESKKRHSVCSNSLCVCAYVFYSINSFKAKETILKMEKNPQIKTGLPHGSDGKESAGNAIWTY